MKIRYQLHTDVLIVGMGGAGIRAAIAASDAGAQVLLTGKMLFGTSGATFYPGTPGWGMQAVIHDGDTEAYFLEEILAAGNGAADPALSRVLAYEATDRFHDLERMGLSFSRNKDGSYRGVVPCFGKRLRGSSVTGMDRIRSVMWREIVRRNIRILERTQIIKLIKDPSGTVGGALGIDALGQFFAVSAGAVILAAGGGCGVYAHSLATADETGDGYLLALEAGARLINMEFVQFIPGLTSPVKKLLFQEKNLITLPHVRNRFGEEILEKYLPAGTTREQCLTERAKHGPFTAEDEGFWFDAAMAEEAAKGNAFEDGGFAMEYDPGIAKDPRWIITDWLSWMHERGIRPEKEAFHMIPHAQCFNGGVYISPEAETDVPGLFACGENAGGAHGADRLGGAAIAATQVFGKRAGESAARFAIRQRNTAAEYIAENTAENTGGNIACHQSEKAQRAAHCRVLMGQIRDIMWEKASIVRSEKRCADALSAIHDLEKEAEEDGLLAFAGDDGERAVFELKSSLTLATLMLKVMEERKETRGPHYRSDYPIKDPALAGAFTVCLRDGEYQIRLVRF